MKRRYNDLASHLRALYGCRVQKISLDAGLSCPNRDGTRGTAGCIYCNVRGAGTGAFGRGASITRQLEEGRAFLSRRYKATRFIAYFQSFSNTYAPLPKLKALYDEALAVPDVVGLSIGTRPDCITPEILDLLQRYARKHLIWVEYGLQSAHDETLARIGRGHDVACFERAVAATAGRGIRICVHVILGLPGETPEMMCETARFISRLPIDGVKLHLLYVVRGTALDALYQSGRYRCLTKAQYADLVCRFIGLLREDIVIQRLTGDPHADELVAPAWAIDKRAVREMIEARLTATETFQGRDYQPSRALK